MSERRRVDDKKVNLFKLWIAIGSTIGAVLTLSFGFEIIELGFNDVVKTVIALISTGFILAGITIGIIAIWRWAL